MSERTHARGNGIFGPRIADTWNRPGPTRLEVCGHWPQIVQALSGNQEGI